METTNESRKRKLSSEDNDDDHRPKKKHHTTQTEDIEFSVDRSNSDAEQKNQIELEYVEELSLASFLPPEILFKIFSSINFKMSDLRNASCVCTSWNSCLKDEAFSWFPLFRDRFTLTLPASFGPPNRFTIYATKETSRNGLPVFMAELFRDSRRLGQSELTVYRTKFLSDVLKSDIYDYEILSKHLQYGTGYICEIDVRINFCRLENKIRNGENAAADMLTAVIMHKLKIARLSEIYNSTDSYTPESLQQIVTETPADVTGVKLHNYQIKAINWMVCRERNVDKGILNRDFPKRVNDSPEFAISPLIPVGRPNMYLNATPTSHDILYLDTAEHVHKYNMKFKAKGGIIADEMGLGKTVEVIGLIVSNPRTDFTPITEEKQRHQTKATLIICPNHLVAQWKSEIEKYCGNKLTVLQITTIVQVRKFTSQNIVDADVVLITYNLLDNDNYNCFVRERKALRDLNDKGIVLSQFDWHRVVADEGHERLASKIYLPNFTSTYCWYMTGTPFPQDHCLTGVRKFLGFTLPETSTHHMHQFDHPYAHTPSRCGYYRYLEGLLDDLMVNNLLWRNTKASIKEEYELVKTKPHYVLLDFNPLEKVIYKDLHAHHDYNCQKFCNTLIMADSGIPLTPLFEQKRKLKRELVARLESEKHSSYAAVRLNQERPLLALYESMELKSTEHAENSLEWMIERYGTKIANFYIYLKELFAKDNEARALVFSTDMLYLYHIQLLLEARGIYTSTIKGNVHKKSKELKNFKNSDSMVRVVLLNTTKVASGMNLIEASHVIFLDVASGSDGEAHEAQAIGRAYRQGQTKHVTVVRFVIKDTKEFDKFVERCPSYLEEQQSAFEELTGKLVRGNSFGVLLANSQ